MSLEFSGNKMAMWYGGGGATLLSMARLASVGFIGYISKIVQIKYGFEKKKMASNATGLKLPVKLADRRLASVQLDYWSEMGL